MSSPDLLFLDAYEQHFSQLLADYEEVHKNFINSLRLKNKEESERLFLKLTDLNKEVRYLIEEFADKIKKINKPTSKYKEVINNKKKDLETLSHKMSKDETIINNLFQSTRDVEGRNEVLRLGIKSSVYFNTFYLIIIFILGILFTRYLMSAESDPSETIVLLLSIVLLFYHFRGRVFGWLSSTITYIDNNRFPINLRFLD